MVTGQKTLVGVVAPNPGIAPEIEGAPVSTPGGNDGTDKTTMTGTPATVAIAPAPVSSDLSGGPNHYAAVSTPAATALPEESLDGPTASTDTGQEDNTPAPVLSAEEQEKADAVVGTDRQIKTIQDWMDAEEHRPETPEQRKKRERREKSKRIIAAVSDGISALSNLYFTSQYAPDMYNHEKGSVLNSVNDRTERIKAEREKTHDQYLNFSLKLGDLQNSRAKTLRELEAQQEARKIARDKAEAEAELRPFKKAIAEAQGRKENSLADKATQDAIAAAYEAANKPESLRLDNAYKKAGITQRNAAAANSYASAGAHNRSNQNEFSAWDEHGNEHKFKTEAAAIAYARQHGTYKETDKTETTNTTDKRGERTTTQRESTKTTKVGHAGKPSPTGRQSPTA